MLLGRSKSHGEPVPASMSAEAEAASAVNPAVGSAPVRVSRRVRVPEHDLVEIDRLGLRAPVAINAEARLCVDEGRAVAASAIVAIGLDR